MRSILNISSYKFISLDNLPLLQSSLKERCVDAGLRGTVLLAEEGINLFLAGEETAVRSVIDWLREDARFSDLRTKDSWSERQPFQKMQVKIKGEIIRMNHPTIRPQDGRSPSVSAEQLRAWLEKGQDEEGRPVLLLDTRNAFEVGYGSFKGAVDLGIQRFSQLPEALQPHLESWKDKTVVSFCTGGIRCEKVGILMRELGLEHSYQLQGGILQYFEEAGDAHYDGSCFVFDEREAIGADLGQADGSAAASS